MANRNNLTNTANFVFQYVLPAIPPVTTFLQLHDFSPNLKIEVLQWSLLWAAIVWTLCSLQTHVSYIRKHFIFFLGISCAVACFLFYIGIASFRAKVPTIIDVRTQCDGLSELGDFARYNLHIIYQDDNNSAKYVAINPPGEKIGENASSTSEEAGKTVENYTPLTTEDNLAGQATIRSRWCPINTKCQDIVALGSNFGYTFQYGSIECPSP